MISDKGILQGLNLRMRNRHFAILDILTLSVTPALALTLFLDKFDWWPQIGRALIFYTVVALFVKLPIFFSVGLYRRYWRYAGVDELMLTIIGVSFSTIVLTGIFAVGQVTLAEYNLAFPRTVPVIDGMLTLLVVSGTRFTIRGIYHRQQRRTRAGGRQVLVVGAGEAGIIVVRELWANPELNMEPAIFVDDDPAKIGTRVQSIPVVGDTDRIPELIAQYQIQYAVVAIPSAPLGRQREIMAICQQAGVITHNLPGVYELLGGYKKVSRFPQFDLNQLLRRELIRTDQAEVAATLRGATVLVTGAGGSIGSELCRQIAHFEPEVIILLGHGENSIFEIALDLHLSFPHLKTQALIVDVRNQRRVNWAVEKYRPQIIFHTAGHKHVPFMENNVEEAVTNNILGTSNIVRVAEKNEVERLVLISTDKAVNPTSIMGATKRMAELLVQATAQQSGRAYMAVRFGNVLGSRGSVVPIFQRQIADGGPLTVTHPDMSRFFMTIPEAVQLVLQAAVLGQGGEVFVLDMGNPVRITELAKDLIRLSGLELGRDIEITYTGIRPGEKLEEELFLAAEDYRRTKYAKIFVATHDSPIETEALEQVVVELVKLCERMQSQDANTKMRVLVSQICHYLDIYQPQPKRQPLSSKSSAASEASILSDSPEQRSS